MLAKGVLGSHWLLLLHMLSWMARYKTESSEGYVNIDFNYMIPNLLQLMSFLFDWFKGQGDV